MVIHCVLFRPAIAQNAGSIARTCVAFGVRTLHLVEPLFDLSDCQNQGRLFVRGSVGYTRKETAQLNTVLYSSCADFAARSFRLLSSKRYFVFSKQAKHGEINFFDWNIGATHEDTEGSRDAPLVCAFGNESSGVDHIPGFVLDGAQYIFIPTEPEMRSLNVAATVAIALCEAKRQDSKAGTGSLL